ncbi:MAG: sugar phosphate nucleotidyltransferase [Alphaproteobacteria bacterium]|nr:sugar phosphate nucleotidyltransferase [Alphaproteobacteria bacterium]
MKTGRPPLTGMVLAAGFGKRLQPLTLKTPKPLLPLGGRPCIDYLVSALKGVGIKNIIINTHYLSEQIHQHFKNDPDVQCIYEPTILETGGAISHVHAMLTDIFITVNGDIWLNNLTMIQNMIDMFDPKTMDALLLMVPRENALYTSHHGDYIKATDWVGDNDIYLPTPFQLQHVSHATPSKDQTAFIYGGLQIWKKSSFLSYCPKTDHFPMITLFHQAQANQRLYGVTYNGLWCDIGTLHAYERIQNHIA